MKQENQGLFTGLKSGIDHCADRMLDQIQCLSMLRQEELQAIIGHIPIKTLKKGSLLLREGQIALNCYYIIQGCVREYYLIGCEEKTTEFFLKGDSLSDDWSKIERTPTRKYWECIEDTTVSVFAQEKEAEMYRRFPRLESLCRIETEKKLGQFQEMMVFYQTSSPEERYLNLLKTRPNLLTRVPQYQLASYLGVKPESLSRIRSRIQSSKERRTAQ